MYMNKIYHTPGYRPLSRPQPLPETQSFTNTTTQYHITSVGGSKTSRAPPYPLSPLSAWKQHNCCPLQGRLTLSVWPLQR
ncbi:hypothetical protein E2C01_002222 [Portunus trituberculatus]|uniref:Uncharacterized protein n=1 Tax=Portunus trituberculatus TaxID=210409 RepID=A0A5B7CKG0_PORTR|nr:hypothetical protein [Portunus trituberculatus]